MKKSIILLAFVLVFSSVSVQAFAVSYDPSFITATAEEPSSRYTLISTISPKLSVSGTKATYSLVVTCIPSVTSINATLQLQKYSGSAWSDYGSSWSASSQTNYLSTDGSKTIESGGSYRLKVTVNVSNTTSSEEKEFYSR